VADDREVSDVVGDDLLPVGAATGVVGGVGALGDDALEPHLLHRLVEGLPLGLHGLHAADASTVHGQAPEQLTAQGEREAAQVSPLGGEHVERPVRGGRRAGRRTGPLRTLLEKRERGTSLGVLHHHLAIEDEIAAGERAEGLDHLGELLRGVASTPVAKPDLLATPLGEDAVAVELQLEPPAGPGECARGPAGELEVHVGQAHVPLGRASRLDGAAKGRGRDRPVARRASAGGHAEGGISTLSWRLVRSARGPSPSAW